MRDNFRVLQGLIFLGLTVLIDVADFSDAFRSARRDPTWETRWRALDPSESSWLAVMAGSRDWLATLTDPEEIALARGFRRHERRWRVYVDLAVLPIMVAVGVLAMADLLPIGALGLIASTFIMLRGFVVYWRERRIKGALEAQRKLAAMT